MWKEEKQRKYVCTRGCELCLSGYAPLYAACVSCVCMHSYMSAPICRMCVQRTSLSLPLPSPALCRQEPWGTLQEGLSRD